MICEKVLSQVQSKGQARAFEEARSVSSESWKEATTERSQCWKELPYARNVAEWIEQYNQPLTSRNMRKRSEKRALCALVV